MNEKEKALIKLEGQIDLLMNLISSVEIHKGVIVSLYDIEKPDAVNELDIMLLRLKYELDICQAMMKTFR